MSKFVCCSTKENQIKELSNPEIDDEDVAGMFRVLSHPLRLKILRVLTVQSEICTCDFTNIFDESQPIVSKQLSKLEKEGLVEKRSIPREHGGRWHAYRLVNSKRSLINYLLIPFTRKDIDQPLCNCSD